MRSRAKQDRPGPLGEVVRGCAREYSCTWHAAAGRRGGRDDDGPGRARAGALSGWGAEGPDVGSWMSAKSRLLS